MYRQFIISMLCLLGCSFSYSETCPKVSDIKLHRLAGWQVYDSDNGKLLTPELAEQFRNNAKQFVLAEWAKHGAVHCYYRDNNGSNLEAYLAKDQFVVKNSQTYWYAVSGFMHCAASAEKCQFQASNGSAQFAKR